MLSTKADSLPSIAREFLLFEYIYRCYTMPDYISSNIAAHWVLTYSLQSFIIIHDL